MGEMRADGDGSGNNRNREWMEGQSSGKTSGVGRHLREGIENFLESLKVILKKTLHNRDMSSQLVIS